MSLLRHVEIFTLKLPDPPIGEADECVLHNLHTLSDVQDLKFGEDVVKRIPNVKKLILRYDYELASEDFCLNNLGHLYKLEYLHCHLPNQNDFLLNPILQHSLKELSLRDTMLSWEDINTKIGSLPHLQALQLRRVSSKTWETIQGHFCSLKYLSIGRCIHWKNWSAESTHFPRLEHLALDSLHRLKEIPCDIGNIPTLESIRLRFCTYSTIKSAKQIAEEQEDLGNESLRITLTLNKFQLEQDYYEVVESLASHNFQVKYE